MIGGFLGADRYAETCIKLHSAEAAETISFGRN